MLCKIILDDMSLYWPAHERENSEVQTDEPRSDNKDDKFKSPDPAQSK